MQAVQRTAHIGGLQELEHNRIDGLEVVEVHFKSPQSVPTVLLAHGGEVVEMIAQVCADREFIGTVGQLYLFAAQEVALIEVAVVPGFVFTAGAGDKYSEIIFQRIAQIYRAAVRIHQRSAELRIERHADVELPFPVGHADADKSFFMMIFDVFCVPMPCSYLPFLIFVIGEPSVRDFTFNGKTRKDIQVFGDAYHYLRNRPRVARPCHVAATQSVIQQWSAFLAASGKNSQPLVTCIYIGLLDKNILVALEVHAHGCYHVQLFFELPLAEPVFVAQSAPYIRIVVNRAEPLLVAHLPQRSIVARVHGGSVFHKRRNLCRCHTATCKNNGQQTDRNTHYGK